MKILLFQIYGQNRIYHLELTYSILSAARFLKDDAEGVRIVLAADADNQRPDLPVDHLLLTPEMLHDWQMGGTYNHAIQAYALHHAVTHFDAPVILIDSDTVVREHPARMFDRIAPGKALMNKREREISETPEWPQWQDLIAKSGGAVGGLPLGRETVMYNAGVLGIDPKDAPLMDDVKAVMHDIRNYSDVFTAVQLAASLVLGAKTDLSVCDDLVDHYWDGPRAYYHYQMNRMFPGVLDGGGIAQPDLPLAPLKNDIPATLSNRIAARIKRMRRAAEPGYAYAYLAYRSALSVRDADRELAHVWAVTALNMLRWGLEHPRPPSTVEDFRLFAPEQIEAQVWMKPDLRRQWRIYWSEPNRPNTAKSAQ